MSEAGGIEACKKCKCTSWVMLDSGVCGSCIARRQEAYEKVRLKLLPIYHESDWNLDTFDRAVCAEAERMLTAANKFARGE